MYRDIILESSNGFSARGFAITALKRQVDFWLGVAVAQSQSSKNNAPVYDSRLREAMGDNGLPEPVKLDVDELNEASAAGFVLLTRHIRTPNPETGARETFREQWCLTPTEVIARTVEFGADRAILDAKAQCAAVGANPEARINVIRTEAAARLQTLSEPVLVKFIEHVKGMQSLEDTDLLDYIAEALTNCGPNRNADATINQAAQAYKDTMKKRAEEGKFFRVDAGIMALAA